MNTIEPKTHWQELSALIPTGSFKTFIFFIHYFGLQQYT